MKIMSPFSALNDFMMELMLSILIISILVTIAIPVYTSYLDKAKISEAIGLMGNAKSRAAEYYSYHGHLPAKTEQLLGIKTSGTYTTNVIINNGAITTTMLHNGLSLSLRPALPSNQKLPKVITYVCGYATPPKGFIVQGENNTNIPPRYLTPVCR
jgi:type IV pilus assembly protein PilA